MARKLNQAMWLAGTTCMASKVSGPSRPDPVVLTPRLPGAAAPRVLAEPIAALTDAFDALQTLPKTAAKTPREVSPLQTLPGPLVRQKGHYLSGATPANKRSLTESEHARYAARSVARRAHVGLTRSDPDTALELTKVSVRTMEDPAGKKTIVRAQPFAQGTFGAVSDVVVVGPEMRHSARVAKKMVIREGASHMKPAQRRDALQHLSVAEVEKELRFLSKYAPRMAPLGVLGRADNIEAILPERFAGHLQQLAGKVRAHPQVEALSAYIGAELFGALAKLHAANVVHRDIKPENLFIARGGVNDRSRLLVGDYGLAVELNLGEATDLSGSDGFRAPEMYFQPELEAMAPYGLKVDVWSAGVSLLQTLADFGPGSRGPFGGGVSMLAPTALAEFIQWRDALFSAPAPASIADLQDRLLEADSPFSLPLLSASQRAPAQIDYLLRHVLVADPNARVSSAEAAAFFAVQGAASAAEARTVLDKLSRPRSSISAWRQATQRADLMAAADVLAGTDHLPLPPRQPGGSGSGNLPSA